AAARARGAAGGGAGADRERAAEGALTLAQATGPRAHARQPAHPGEPSGGVSRTVGHYRAGRQSVVSESHHLSSRSSQVLPEKRRFYALVFIAAAVSAMAGKSVAAPVIAEVAVELARLV